MAVWVEGGRAVKIAGNRHHPFTRGFLCVKVNNYLDRVYGSDRVLYPHVRVGAKGSGNFQRVTWQEAIELIAVRFKELIGRHGAESILPYSYAGTMGLLNYSSMDRRFFNRLGASRLGRTICSVSAKMALQYTMGTTLGIDPEDMAGSKLIIQWGTNTVSTNVHLVPLLREARRRGALIVTIDPHRTATADLGQVYLQIKPGTDAALALGMMNVIVQEELYDADYVDRYTLGFEKLRERVKEYPPERVEAITGIPRSKIVELARLYATLKPSTIRMNYGVQRHANGGMAVRAIACLPALVGAWKDVGGGLLLSTSAAFPVDSFALERPDLVVGNPRTVNMNQIGEALLEADPPICALYVYNSNPAAVAPNRAKVLKGLKREDLFTVVHDLVWTETADLADVVLPATSTLEHLDLHTSYGHMYLQLNRPAIEPLGESKPNTEVFRLLAKAMGFEEPCFQDTDEDLIRQALYSRGPLLTEEVLTQLWERGWVKLPLPRPYLPFAEGGFPTPSGKVEFYCERLARDGLDPLPRYDPPAESPERDPELARKYPLQLVSAAAHHFLNSSFGNVPKMRRLEGRPKLEINPADAEARGIQTGDIVKIFNDRGHFFSYAEVTDAVGPGVVFHPSIWWDKFSSHPTNANWTTSDRLSDMGGGATFHDNLVEVTRTEGELKLWT
jgi:anaerobic selenocysteine-containing dehydrogenase